jgi:hypothetical protein
MITLMMCLMSMVSFAQNIVVLSNLEKVVSDELITEIGNNIQVKYYRINSTTGLKSSGVSKAYPKKDVWYYVNGVDTSYINIELNGVIYSKAEALNIIMLQKDPHTYYQNKGYEKLKSSGNKLLLTTIIGVGGTIIATSLAINGNVNASSGVIIASSLASFIIGVSANIDLKKAGEFLLKSNPSKEYIHNGISLKD